MKQKARIFFFTLFLLTGIFAAAIAGEIALLVIDADTYIFNKALEGIDLPGDLTVEYFTEKELQNNKTARRFVEKAEVIIVDVMVSELSDYLLQHVKINDKRVYALRGSRNDAALKEAGFIFDQNIQDYYNHLTVANIQNMIYCATSAKSDSGISCKEPETLPEIVLYHPEGDGFYETYEKFNKWYENRSIYDPEKPRVGFLFFSSFLMEGQRKTADTIIERFEKGGLNVYPAFGKDEKILTRFFLDESGTSRVDLAISFSLKFYSSLNNNVKSALFKMDVPVINAINLYANTVKKWRKDPVGIPPMDVVWNIANPEISGLIEPTPLSGKKKIVDPETGRTFYVKEPILDNIDLITDRIKKWHILREKPNSEKRIAILYYNHSQGKQNIGASYLNVFKSLSVILDRMRSENYTVGAHRSLNEKTLKELILSTGRNVGSWAPGELEAMIQNEEIVRLSVETYKSWFDRLPEAFRKRVVEQWGAVENCRIMTDENAFIIPAVKLDNVVVMPEPSRGFGDDPMKLYHDSEVYPHHQYIAAYLWIRYAFDADAVIHLGTHATHEWLPGKQAGLSRECPPEVLITDLPNLYPYIVDDVGEGIQAKRRGRGVIIDHLIPPIVKSGLYKEYAKLAGMISDLEQSKSLDSKTVSLKREQIEQTVRKLGLDRDIGIKELNDEGIEEIEHYLMEIKESFMPYGLHTFGKPYPDEAFDEMVTYITGNNPDTDPENLRKRLKTSSQNEINRLLKGLGGGFIPPGEGNDPGRNPAAVPTGKNFYGFSPEKIPSKSAWKLGAKAAHEIIEKKMAETKRYPGKVGVVLWATETIRNEGINESTILYLMGMRPVWDASERVTGVEAIPARELGRPRIDVLINPSGLYRDLFPNMLILLDKAVQQAAVLDDIDNLIRKHNSKIKTRLMERGMSEKEADVMSRMRIFTEKPGAYGTGVSEMTGLSGIWESPDEIVEVYENKTGYAFGQGRWGKPARNVLKENLADVDSVVHSISSGLYGTMDNDDMFQYLGGLSMAAAKESGKTPYTLVTKSGSANKAEVETLNETLGKELTTRYLNPRWIEGMKKENYAGAGEMDKFVNYMWGWQVTTPESMNESRWENTYDVYVRDKYSLGLKEFFNRENPWAYQSMTARMLETVRKGYWKADEKKVKKLSVEYALNVVEKGVACCDHTCNNPMLNQMVVNVISIPGVMSPEMVERFRIAIEKAGKKTLDKQVEDRKKLQKKLTDGFEQPRKETQPKKNQSAEKNTADDVVEGYKMEKIEQEETETELTSSGVQWFASLFIFFLITLFAYGTRKRL
jgi:cobaltochelatase CobN